MRGEEESQRMSHLLDYLNPKRWEEIDPEWEREPDTDRWEHAGLRCAIFRMKSEYGGNLCGYVGLRRTHPLFGVVLREPHPRIEFLLRRRLSSPVDIATMGLGRMLSAMSGDGEKATLENAIDVHGGITWCDRWHVHSGYARLNRNMWWIGFDCAHSGDLVPRMEMRMRGVLGERPVYGRYRNMEYVRAETERLARQLSIFE